MAETSFWMRDTSPNEEPGAVSITATSRLVSWSGRKPFGMMTYSHPVSARVAKVTTSMKPRRRSAQASVTS